MKPEIDRQKWCVGRFGMKGKPPMTECYWNVCVKTIITISLDNTKTGVGFRFQWNAFTNDNCHVHFKQEIDIYGRNHSRTGSECRKNWESFASKNKLKHYGFVPIFEDWHSKYFNAKVEMSNPDDYKDKLGAMGNEYAALANYLICEHGRFGGANISRATRYKRVNEMKKDGRWNRLKEIEKAAKSRDIKFLEDYNDIGYLNQYRPDKYLLPKKKVI